MCWKKEEKIKSAKELVITGGWENLPLELHNSIYHDKSVKSSTIDET